MVCIINRYFFIRKIIVKDILDNPNAKGNKTSFTVNDANKMEEKCDRILKNHNKNQDDE
jgi:5-formaminoimidazole-4-carboxamide-1-beta-D-ribofuranosyl 5'-monophosphate synthetase